MREVVLDTETTGLDPASGHRVVEIGCVELVNHVPSGAEYHVYLNPERDMPDEAFRIHGLSGDFLADKPVFADVAEDLLAFLGDSPLVIHNASFDLGFLNAELDRADRPAIPMDRAVDTVTMARRKYPGAQASLDALCRRFDIDLSERSKHGALLDANLLAAVYLELVGGRQPGLGLAAEQRRGAESENATIDRPVRRPRPHAPTEDELARHAAFVDKLAAPVWRG